MSKIQYLKKLLETIEGLCIVFQNGDKSSSDRANKIIDDIYCIAHLASDCKNLHIDWRDKLNKIHDDLKKQGVI